MKRRLPPPLVEIPKKRIAPNGLPLPNPIREGELLTDITQKKWKLGRSIGLGGFGEIYLASDVLDKPVNPEAKYVIKVEPHKNGPLFVEMNFYIRAAKIEKIESWMAKRKVPVLGMPHYVGSGSHRYNGEHYRFLVLPRYGQDLQKVFLQRGRRFHIKTVFTLASYIMDILQYVHDHEYIHADIKACNLMLGFASQAPVYLLDYGLATRYLDRNGNHKKYMHDERRAHDGTIEFTSRDAHIGVHSRRGDLEILGYNLVKWLTGKLPWEESDLEPEDVQKRKIAAMRNINQFLKNSFAPSQPPDALHQFLQYVSNLGFETKPDYKYCKQIFRLGIREAGFEDDGLLTFTNHQKKQKIKKKKVILLEPENKGIKPRVIGAPTRQPCAPRNDRISRNIASMFPTLRSQSKFDWAFVLAGNPEKMLRKDKSANNLPVTKDHHVISHSNKAMDRVQSLSCSEAPEILNNPTPEMIKVWKRMKQRLNEQQTNKRSKNGSRCSSPVQCDGESLTPAMEEVLRRRRETTPRAIRCARRGSGRNKAAETCIFKKNTEPIRRRTKRSSSLKG